MCPLQRAPSGASSLSQFPLLGLTFAQALSRPLSPDFTPPPPALTPPELGSPHAGQAQGRLPAPQRRTSSSASPPAPGFRLAPGPPPAPVPDARTLPASLAPAPVASAQPRSPATRRLPAGPARPTQAPHSQSAAATLRPEPGWGVGTSGCRAVWARRANAG